MHADTLAALGNDVADALSGFHEEAPQSPGLTADQLQQRTGLAKNVLSAVVEHLVGDGTVARREGRLALARHTVSLSSEEQKRLEQDVPPDLQERFNRIASVRDGIALSEAADERCSTCHQRLRPQVWHEVRHTDKMATCDGCGRILYYEQGPSAP